MSNLLEQAINCDDADQAAREALGIESDDVVNYCFPKDWPADYERRARYIGEWLKTEARFASASPAASRRSGRSRGGALLHRPRRQRARARLRLFRGRAWATPGGGQEKRCRPSSVTPSWLSFPSDVGKTPQLKQLGGGP